MMLLEIHIFNNAELGGKSKYSLNIKEETIIVTIAPMDIVLQQSAVTT